MVRRLFLIPLLAVLPLTGCGQRESGALDIAFIASEDSLFAGGLRLSSAAQHLRAATGTGMVALDEYGETIPALADRWIVTDDGMSFIFRLREGSWPDGSEITAESARAALLDAIRRLRGTSLGLDLAPIEEVRAMAGRVVEIRLSGPVPTLLQLLAQPELALSNNGEGAGPMELRRQGSLAILTMKAPEQRGLPADEEWQDHVRTVRIHAAGPQQAIDLFEEGEVDAVLGGRIGSLPLADTGPLSRGTVRIDPAIGLFGMQVRNATGLLATPEGREVLSMALDRAELMAPFNIGGWVATTRIVPPGLPGGSDFNTERWVGIDMDQRRAEASARVAEWLRLNPPENGEAGADRRVVLTLAIGDEPGLQTLFRQIADQLSTVRIRLERAEDTRRADLVLVDRVARFAGPRWFLDQFNCSLRRGVCDDDADYLVEQAIAETDPQVRSSLLSEAEASLNLANAYIPFGSPLRWSLIRGNVDGFAANAWAFHPLPPMATLPR
ncbi:oligopeptide transport system substrate-binding protein [Altererythrobacter atlanticus]|uniref:Binding protein YgiS n=1 Tax=Croceibacterium atlanticum TaxID=1267766 RepID=A0A0F7KWG6_9SPHN|nr:ABC transporter substrate-binding protein [Croceibacterium atlanticum]AKH43496.1 Putative binding protein YgiS precursor [Croceibacterium atlanticum]MBB5731796.1 oligopeptide transport system substrate-binding protein [Croceibacterium atlanticum]